MLGLHSFTCEIGNSANKSQRIMVSCWRLIQDGIWFLIKLRSWGCHRLQYKVVPFSWGSVIFIPDERHQFFRLAICQVGGINFVRLANQTGSRSPRISIYQILLHRVTWTCVELISYMKSCHSSLSTPIPSQVQILAFQVCSSTRKFRAQSKRGSNKI